MTQKVKKAVFPVAGLGTRFLPATKASAKEMMPVVDKPLIQYAVEEAVGAGLDTMIFINGKNKRAIEDHFDSVPELERQLKQYGKSDMLEIVRHIAPEHVSYIYLRQASPFGLGHAVSCAEPAIGDEPFAVLLADDLIVPVDGASECIANLVETYTQYDCSVVAVEKVASSEANLYGILSGEEVADGIWRVDSLVEKPQAGAVSGNLAIVGRYVLKPEIFGHLRKTQRGVGNEIQLTDAIIEEVKKGKVMAQLHKAKRYDCGSKLGYLIANVEMALLTPEIGADFCNYLRRLKL